jgi:hypothetical protein
VINCVKFVMIWLKGFVVYACFELTVSQRKALWPSPRWHALSRSHVTSHCKTASKFSCADSILDDYSGASCAAFAGSRYIPLPVKSARSVLFHWHRYCIRQVHQVDRIMSVTHPIEN